MKVLPGDFVKHAVKFWTKRAVLSSTGDEEALECVVGDAAACCCLLTGPYWISDRLKGPQITFDTCSTVEFSK